jgi:hypothetical protein
MTNAAETQRDTVKPVYPTGPSTIPLDSIFRFVNLLKKHGQTSEFRRAAEAAGAFVTADPETVKFVKDFVAANAAMRQDSLGARVLRPPRATAKKHLAAKAANGHQCQLS